MSWKALITDAGNELSAKTISGGNIKLTHAKAGSGTVSEQDLHLQTELVNVKQTLSIESIKYSNAVNNIEILLDCRGLKEAYDLAQIGIYATDPDAREILFAIAQTENPKHIPAENEVPFYSIDFNFAFALKNNQNMVATIDQSTFATKEQLSAVDARIDNIIVNAGSTEDNAELIDMRVDVDGKRHSTAGEALRSQLKQKANLTDISSPYQFRGACLSANLPGSGNKINDTYYVTDKKCKFTWNGAAWYQSSLNESDYEEELSSLTEDLDNVYNTTELTPVPTNKITPTEILDKSVYYNSTYGLLGFTNNGDNLKCNIYPIIKGKSYYLRGNGKNHEGCPVAIFAESYVSDGTTKYKEVVSGESEKLHNIKKFFKASYDGYIYINCINESDGLFNVEYVSNIQKINNSLKNELDCKLSLYGEFQLVESTIINNKVFNINKLTEQNQSDGCYMREKINNDDDIIRVSGYSYSSNISYPLIAFFDEYDNIIEYYGDASTLYSDKIFKIPYRTNYIIVNGKTSNIKVEKFILKNNLTETVESLKKQTTFANIKSVEKQNEKYEIKNIKISDFEIIQNKLYTFTAKMDESDRYSTVLLKFNLELNSIKILYGAGVYGGAFLDKDKKYISSINAGTLDVVVTVPQDTTYIAYTYSNGMTDFEIGVLYNIYESKQFTVPGISHFLNPWENKKIVLLGTSVGFGSNATTSYIYEASKYLGFNFVNTSVPGLAIHTESDGRPLIYGSSSLSVSEYASNGKILSTAPVDYVPGGKYNTYYQSYERIFTDKNADADLWLYAVAPNNDNFDLKDWNDFNKSSWKYNDESGFDEHRTTFIGALLFLMNKMYELNPNARMAFVLDSAFAYGDSQGGGNIKTVANYWGIPVIDLWGKINRSPKSLEVIKSKNGTDSHPSTFGHEKMGMMMVGELLRIG